MDKNFQILHLLATLDSQQSVNKLVEVCYKIALSTLRFNYKRVHKIIVRDELSLDDIAIDSITSLFVRDEENKFFAITLAFNSWQPPIKTEEEVLYFLNKLVQKRVEQHISLMLREADPFFARLMDSVNYLIKKYDFNKINHFGTVYVVNSSCNEILSPTISVEEFQSLPYSLFADRKSLLQNLFSHLSSNTTFFAAIPFNTLINKLKELNISLYKISESTKEHSETFEINAVVDSALENVFKKLNEAYLVKGKLSEEEAKVFRKTLNEMAEDLKDGGVNPGLYNYLSANFPGLEEECYKQKYHNIIEYLLKLLKKDIADQLVE